MPKRRRDSRDIKSCRWSSTTHGCTESFLAAVEVIERELSFDQKPEEVKAVRVGADIFSDLYQKIKSGEISEEEFARFLRHQP